MSSRAFCSWSAACCSWSRAARTSRPTPRARKIGTASVLALATAAPAYAQYRPTPEYQQQYQDYQYQRDQYEQSRQNYDESRDNYREARADYRTARAEYERRLADWERARPRLPAQGQPRDRGHREETGAQPGERAQAGGDRRPGEQGNSATGTNRPAG